MNLSPRDGREREKVGGKEKGGGDYSFGANKAPPPPPPATRPTRKATSPPSLPRTSYLLPSVLPPSTGGRKQQLSRLSIFPFLTSFPSLPWGEVARAAPASVASLSLGRAIKKSQKRKPWGKAKEEKKGKKEQSHPPLLRDNRGAPAPSDKRGKKGFKGPLDLLCPPADG